MNVPIYIVEAPTTKNLLVKRAPKTAPIAVKEEVCDDVEILCATVSRPPPPMNVLQQLRHTPHSVYGDGNCLYYAIAHQAGYVEPSSHGDRSVSQLLQMLALICMQSIQMYKLRKDYHYSNGRKDNYKFCNLLNEVVI